MATQSGVLDTSQNIRQSAPYTSEFDTTEESSGLGSAFGSRFEQYSNYFGSRSSSGINPDGTIDPNWAQQDPAGAQGALTRAQWDDYMKRYAPLEDQLISFVNQDSRAEVEKAGAYAQMGADSAQGALERDTERRGLQVTPEQAKAVANRSKLQSSLDVVGAKNNATRTIADRNYQTMGNLVGMGKGVASTAAASLSGAAGMASSREAQDKAAGAASKQQNMQMAGTAVGLAAATSSSWLPLLLAL